MIKASSIPTLNWFSMLYTNERHEPSISPAASPSMILMVDWLPALPPAPTSMVRKKVTTMWFCRVAYPHTAYKDHRQLVRGVGVAAGVGLWIAFRRQRLNPESIPAPGAVSRVREADTPG